MDRWTPLGPCPESCRPLLGDELARDLKMLTAYADSAPMNYLHKLRLVEAEQARVAAQHERAVALYGEALQLAEAGGFTPEAALAHELWSRFVFVQGDGEGAGAHRRCAGQLYAQWGATAKAAALQASIPSGRQRIDATLTK